MWTYEKASLYLTIDTDPIFTMVIQTSVHIAIAINSMKYQKLRLANLVSCCYKACKVAQPLLRINNMLRLSVVFKHKWLAKYGI